MRARHLECLCCELREQPPRKSGESKTYEYNGHHFSSQEELCRYLNLTDTQLRHRVRNEQCLLIDGRELRAQTTSSKPGSKQKAKSEAASSELARRFLGLGGRTA